MSGLAGDADLGAAKEDVAGVRSATAIRAEVPAARRDFASWQRLLKNSVEIVWLA